MESAPLYVLYLTILVMIVLSAYFSSSETAMMSLNRYRLRHLAKDGHHGGAARADALLQRPDRLLGIILFGNNVVNFFAGTVATVIALRQFGEIGLAIAPFVLTFVFLVFAEVAPKTIAAARPEVIAFPSAYVLTPMLRLLYPVVWVLNACANAIVRPFIPDPSSSEVEKLSPEELRTLLHEGAHLPIRRQGMLLSILDLEKVTVNDIMVPRSEINGIDIEDDLDEIVDQICSSTHTRLPVYKGAINDVIGILHLRNATRFLRREELTRAALLQETREPYFIPETTPLHIQLFNFQKEERRIGLVVDEYGDVQGIVTLEDILEEIVGEFTSDMAARIPEIHPQDDGAFIIDGTALLREINRGLGWELPLDGPRTLNGLVIEHLEFIPEAPCCLRIGDYRIEVLQIKDNMIRTARIVAPEVEIDPDAQDDDEDDDG